MRGLACRTGAIDAANSRAGEASIAWRGLRATSRVLQPGPEKTPVNPLLQEA